MPHFSSQAADTPGVTNTLYACLGLLGVSLDPNRITNHLGTLPEVCTCLQKNRNFGGKLPLKGPERVICRNFDPPEGCAGCVHILSAGREYLLGSFKAIKCILGRFWVPGQSTSSSRPKSADFRPKSQICKNFG